MSFDGSSPKSVHSERGSVELKPLFGAGSEETDYSYDSQKSSSPEPAGGGGGHGEFGVGTASKTQVAVNIFISFVGCGMLGMPYAFSQAGWVLSIIALFTMSTLNVYAMLLLVKTRGKLESKGHTDIEGYGDVGRVIAGSFGEKLVNTCLVITQIGFATAYIIFIAANINNIAGINRAYICFGCVPILAVLIQLKEMKHLSPFSLIADVANLAGLSAVLFQDWKSYNDYHDPVIAYNFSKVLYVASVSLYALEGVGMVLPLESSCQDRKWFPSLLRNTVFAITVLMAVFGICGYFAWGSATEAPVTLNLDGGPATIVKLALCVGLYLTFPIMMFPVNEVMEDLFLGEGSRNNKVFRATVVVFSCTVAWLVPDFGQFLGLVGASLCTILGFILPCYFHLQAFEKSELKWWELILDRFLIVFGIAFGIMGTYTSFVDLINDEKSGVHL